MIRILKLYAVRNTTNLSVAAGDSVRRRDNNSDYHHSWGGRLSPPVEKELTIYVMA